MLNNVNKRRREGETAGLAYEARESHHYRRVCHNNVGMYGDG